MTWRKFWQSVVGGALCGAMLLGSMGVVNAGGLEIANKLGKEKIKIACIGDSVTWGVGGTPYPQQLQNMLGARYEVKNFGISGATARNDGHDNNINEGHLFGYRTGNPNQGDWNYGDVYGTVYTPSAGKSKYQQSLDYQADIYIISIGGNDSKNCNWDNGGAAGYKSHLRSLVEEYMDLPHKPLVILGTSPSAYKSSYGLNLTALSETIVPAQRELAKELGLISVETFEPTVGVKDYFIDDGVHLTTAGYKVVAEQYAAAIKTLEESFSSATLTDFRVNGVAGTIDEATASVYLTLPKGTTLYNLTATIKVGEAVSELAGLDLSDVYTLTATSADGTATHDYAVYTAFSEAQAMTIKKTPTARTFTTDDAAVDVTGGTVEVTYADHTTRDYPIRPEMVTGFEAAAAGMQELTVSLYGLTDAYTVTVYERTLWGDADDDGKVTSTDARLTLQVAADKIGLDGLNSKMMNVDGDDAITTTDARLILQCAAEKIDTLGTAVAEQTYRVFLSSDVHSGHVYYNFDPEQRLQEYVDFVNAEHKKQAFDLMIFMGDYSLDYWINGGTVLHQDRRDAKTFVDKWVSQLPDVPKFFLAGNHEQYSDEEWQAITGNARSGCVKLGDNTFVLLDAFAGDLDPKKDADGTYVNLDYTAIQTAVDENPNGNVWVMAHFIDHGGESANFKRTIANNDAVRGMFMGHRHSRDLIQAGAAYGNKVIAQTGNFADSRNEGCIWGFRDLIITGKSAVSRYLIAPIKQGQVNNEYSISRQVQYNEDGTTTIVPDKQENIFEKMGRSGINMQSGNFTETFSPQDLSAYETLSFDLTFTTNVDFDNLVCTKSQFELTSSGGPDLNEWNWNMLDVLRSIGGTHMSGEKLTITLNMDELKPETKSGDQTLDLKNVTYLRWYCKELKSPLAFDIGNFRFE